MLLKETIYKKLEISQSEQETWIHFSQKLTDQRGKNKEHVYYTYIYIENSKKKLHYFQIYMEWLGMKLKSWKRRHKANYFLDNISS